MINYTEKGNGLHDAIRDAGHWLREENGAWVASDETAVQAIIDTYDPLPGQRAELRTLVADERVRRQLLGVTFTFPGGVVGTIQTRNEQDLVNIGGLATRAVMFSLAGQTDATLVFRDLEDRTHAMTVGEISALAVTAAGFVEALYQAKWAHDNAIAAWDGTQPYDVLAGWPG